MGIGTVLVVCGILVIGGFFTYNYIQETRPFDTKIKVNVGYPGTGGILPTRIIDRTKYDVSVYSIDYYDIDLIASIGNGVKLVRKDYEMGTVGFQYVGYFMSNDGKTTNFVFAKLKV